MSRARIATLLLAVSVCACSSRPELTEVPLKTLAGAKAAPLSACPTTKCVTVVVTPWSGVCHAAAPNILELQKHLAAAGITTRIVVGQAEMEKLTPFAGVFGPETQLDAENAVPVKSGVPMFVVTDDQGKLLKRINGFPSGPLTPENLAAALDLP